MTSSHDGVPAAKAPPHHDHTIARTIRDAPRQADRLLWHFVPDASVARQFGFQQFMASTFLSDGAREAVRYGALISIAGAGGSPLRSALLGAIGLVPPTLLGILGGTIADALPRQ